MKLSVAASLVVLTLAASPATAQDLSQVMQKVADLMDDAVLQIHRSSRRPRPDKPVEHIDKALESQREVLEILDELIKEVEKAPS